MSLCENCELLATGITEVKEHLTSFDDGKGVAGAAVQARVKLSTISKLISQMRKDIQEKKPAPKKRTPKTAAEPPIELKAEPVVDIEDTVKPPAAVKFADEIAAVLDKTMKKERTKSPVKKPRKKRLTAAEKLAAALVVG
jgi:hypothetical protein